MKVKSIKTICFVAVVLFLCACPTPADAVTIIGESVRIDYYGYAFLHKSISQSGKVEVRDPGAEFIAKAPSGGIDLFSIDISENTITITGVDSYSNNDCLEFEWKFVVDSSNSVAFDGAELVFSSLFSIPPFTFSVNPKVSFDSATSSIVVSRFIAAGAGTAVVNEGGQAVIEFTIIPEPSTIVLLGLGGLLIKRRRALRRSLR
jgi:hypothetical protein